MIDEEPEPRDANATHGDGEQTSAFLGSHRGQAAFAREYARLASAVVAGVGHATRDHPELTSVIRQAPERCIVQLGSVALTVAWLRKGPDPSAIGELLLILWRGTIAQRPGEPSSFSVKPKKQSPPTILWEETLIAAADSEADWTWRPELGDLVGVNSDVLAERAVASLLAIHRDDTDLPRTTLTFA